MIIGFYKICGGVLFLNDIVFDVFNRVVEDGSDVIIWVVGLILIFLSDLVGYLVSWIVESGIFVVIFVFNVGGFFLYWIVILFCIGGFVICVGVFVLD